LAVVSDVDDGGFALNVDKRVERICRAITKQVQRSDARIEVDVMHTGMNALSKRRGCIEVQSLDKECTTREGRKGVQGLDKYVNLEPSVPRSQS
jgi:hypothetical protein